MAEKQYCGKGKIGKFADTFRVGLRADQLPQPNAGGYINLIMAKMKQPDKMGNEYTL